MHIDRDGIARLLPHRDPILLLEDVWIDEPGVAGRSHARIPTDAAFMTGIDGAALRQELALEAAAQTLGVVLGSARPADDRARPEDERHLLLGFDRVGFEAAYELAVHAFDIRVLRDEASGGVCNARFWITADGIRYADGRVMVMKGAA